MTKSHTRSCSVVAVCTVAGLLALPTLPSAQEAPSKDEVFQEKCNPGSTTTCNPFLSIPGLEAFDISWVDTSINRYFLADRSNREVDVAHTGTQTPTLGTPITSTPNAFAGARCSDGSLAPCTPPLKANNDISGPNGVLTLTNTSGDELWVGDGPTPDPICLDPTVGVGFSPCSTVKVFPATASGPTTPTHTIPTAGHKRADELCFDPKDKLVMIANDAEDPHPFINIISTVDYKVKQKIVFTTATNGIEQCQWNPRTSLFYINVPEVNGPGDDTKPGAVFVFKVDAPNHVTQVATFTIPIAKCAGPQGMAIGPSPQILLGCNAPSIPNGPSKSPNATLSNSVIINENSGSVMATLTELGGADEVWFNPSDGHYFIAQSGDTEAPTEAQEPGECGQSSGSHELGIADAQTKQADQTVCFNEAKTASTHSVAADSVSNLVFVPVSEGIAVFQSNTPEMPSIIRPQED